MEKHIQDFLNRLSFASIAVATLILILLFIQTPETCVPPGSVIKPHLKFPKSSCDYSPRELVSVDKKNKRLWSTKTWQKQVSSFTEFFGAIRDLGLLSNHSKVLCVSAGAGHEVMALSTMGVVDVTGVELLESPPLVRRADPHDLPFFDNVFDLAFSAHLTEALFPSRFVSEMERTVRSNGTCVILVEECGDEEVRQIIVIWPERRKNSIRIPLWEYNRMFFSKKGRRDAMNGKLGAKLSLNPTTGNVEDIHQENCNPIYFNVS